MTLRTLMLGGLLSTTVGCIPKTDDTSGLEDDTSATGDDTSTTGDDTSGSGDDTADDTALPPPIIATVRGTITVEAFVDGPDGREEVDEAAYFDGGFPYGPIFVTGTQDDGSGGLSYKGSDAILSPTFAGDTYEMTVTLAEDGSIRVFAILDEQRNYIIQTTDPVGVYPDDVAVIDGDVVNDVDITILVEANTNPGGGGGGGGGGGTGSGGGGPGCDVNLSGDFDVVSTSFVAGRAGLAMLTSTSGDGPVQWGWVEPAVTATGGEGTYSFDACPSQGQMNLVGAWDSNANTLIDPHDQWGAYVVAPDTDGNPVTIGTTDMSGMDIQVPIGEGESPLSVVPFVQISGNVSVGGGTFDDLPAGTTVYVAALKYRPSGAVSASTMESDAYDYEAVEWPDLTGNSSFAYDLGVPAGTVVYLWAYADEDVDGLVNESGEAVASGGTDDNGRMNTGSSDHTEDLELGYAATR
jgi:hypothetical protein